MLDVLGVLGVLGQGRFHQQGRINGQCPLGQGFRILTQSLAQHLPGAGRKDRWTDRMLASRPTGTQQAALVIALPATEVALHQVPKLINL